MSSTNLAQNLDDSLDDNRVIGARFMDEDHVEKSLRPQTLEEFIGQDKLRDNLRVFVQAARERKQSLDHVLLYGPPGLGKTTLAQIVAREMGVGFKATSAPIITKTGDLA
ncbi:MAG: AAA family ATPase, partial [Alphaproteobacteria bacterium]|nr:AAA family ATPase [Alphaproteobacteria bacterium]